MSTRLQRQYESSPFHGANAPYVEALYEAYLDDPSSVPSEWRTVFSGLGEDSGSHEVAHAPVVAALERRLRSPAAQATNGSAAAVEPETDAEDEASVAELVEGG